MQDVRTLPVRGSDEVTVTLDELAREGARRMLAQALEAEVEDDLARFADDVGEDGKRLVVRNGCAKERGLTVGSGTMRLRAPRVVRHEALLVRAGCKTLPPVRRSGLAKLRAA